MVGAMKGHARPSVPVMDSVGAAMGWAHRDRHQRDHLVDAVGGRGTHAPVRERRPPGRSDGYLGGNASAAPRRRRAARTPRHSGYLVTGDREATAHESELTIRG
jgi:hypothetical protein